MNHSDSSYIQSYVVSMARLEGAYLDTDKFYTDVLPYASERAKAAWVEVAERAARRLLNRVKEIK